MEQETLHQRYLVVIALILCAVIAGYNAFYVPDASLSGVTVSVDSSSSALSSVPSGSAGEEYTPKAPSASSGQKTKSAVSTAPAGKININMATARQLSDGLDGVGDVMAKRIVEYREKHGPFHSVTELKNVSGIGDKIFERIRNSVTVDG